MTPSQAQWNCEVSGIPEQGLTVGAPFALKCAGAEVSGLSPQTLSLELSKQDKYRLHILENKSVSSTGVDLLVTSYVPGDTSLKDVVLTDGVNRISLSGVNYTVMSVLKEDAPQEPYAAEDPTTLSWPASVLISMGAFVVIAVAMVIYFVQRQARKKKFRLWLEAQKTPLSPFDQLNKDLRRAQKERNPSKQIAELQILTETYLSREFQKPLLDASPKAVLKAVSGDDRRLSAKLRPLVMRLYGEFERLPGALEKSQVSANEALNTVLPQIHEMVREFGETVNAAALRRKDGAQRGGLK